MKLIELVQQAKAASSDLEKLSDAKAAALVRQVFLQIGDLVEATEEGKINVTGLGQFNISKVVREKDGQSQTIKRVVFRPMKPKA